MRLCSVRYIYIYTRQSSNFHVFILGLQVWFYLAVSKIPSAAFLVLIISNLTLLLSHFATYFMHPIYNSNKTREPKTYFPQSFLYLIHPTSCRINCQSHCPLPKANNHSLSIAAPLDRFQIKSNEEKSTPRNRDSLSLSLSLSLSKLSIPREFRRRESRSREKRDQLRRAVT